LQTSWAADREPQSSSLSFPGKKKKGKGRAGRSLSWGGERGGEEKRGEGKEGALPPGAERVSGEKKSSSLAVVKKEKKGSAGPGSASQ